MDLIIGGYKQGKRAYVEERYADTDVEVLDDLHLWIQKQMKSGVCAKSCAKEILHRNDLAVQKGKTLVVICDEVGNGLVPMEQDERTYRDMVGQVLILLAREAKGVTRVICGIGQKIK